MNQLPFLAQRIFNQPVAIAPGKAEIIVSALAERLGVNIIDTRGISEEMRQDFYYGDAEGDHPEKEKGYDVVKGVGIIPVSGTLVHKNGYLRPFSGMTGYDGIRQNFLTALDDPNVKAIAFDIDSPGGEVSGCFDLVDTIYENRGEKPIMSICSDYAFSAAYAIASAAEFIAVPRTGGTGSVGVVAMHVDYSQALEKAGLTVTLVQYGKRKTDTAETKPLSSEALANLQSDVDAMGKLFVETVARNRAISRRKVRETEAGIFLGQKGVDAGFADAVMSPHEALAALLDMTK